MVKNEGIYEFAPLEHNSEEHFNNQYKHNVLVQLLTTQEAVKYFGPAGGSVINLSSVVGVNPLPNAAVYSATKAEVDAITKSLAKELGPKKIRVNSINPGMIETEGVHAAGFLETEFPKMVVSQTPLGRIGQPQDIGKVATFFASDDSGWVTGETLLISGGMR